MPDTHIDRLTLRLSGLTVGDGRELARQVANRLTPNPLSAAAALVTSAPIRVRVTSAPNRSTEQLARQIADEIRRQLD